MINNIFLGGTLSLFTGMSWISMIEIIYWIMRPFFIRRTLKTKHAYPEV